MYGYFAKPANQDEEGISLTFPRAALLSLAILTMTGCGKSIDSNGAASSQPSLNCKEISRGDEATLVAKVAELQIGDSQSKVESLLGKPDAVNHPASKSTGEAIGTEYVYFVKKCDESARAGWHDAYVRLSFRPNERLGLIEGIRVQGVVARSEELPK